MSSRALILATVLIGLMAASRTQAQENLDAGKTPSQIFAGTCNACHKSPRGLLKTVSPSSLPSFLRQHYTTSPNMAGVLASYLVSNGATDTRLGGDTPKGAKGVKEGAKEGARQEARQEPQRPGGPVEQLDRWGRRIHSGAAPQESAAPAAEPRYEPKPETDQAAAERRNAKQKLTKRGKPGEELPKEAPKEEPSISEVPRELPKSEAAAREESKPEARPEAAKPAEEGHSQSAKIEQPQEAPALRSDPVPPVTPAPPSNANAPATTATAPVTSPAPAAAAPPASAPAPVQTAVAPPPTEMAVPLPAASLPPPPPPAVTASTSPPLPPVAPAGPPVPPISQ